MGSVEQKEAEQVYAAGFKELFYSRHQSLESPDAGLNETEEPDLSHSGKQESVECFVLEGDYKLENLKSKQVDLSPLKRNDVLIEVRFVGLNFSDLYSIQGFFFKKNFPFIPGNECSGVVLATGSNVEDFKVGDKVMVFRATGGMLSEKVVVDKKYVFPAVDFKYGAAILCTYLTAMEIVYNTDLFKSFRYENEKEIDKEKIQKTVLFHGCGGGVAHAFYDLTKHMKVKHLGTCSKSKLADVPYESFSYENWEKEVRSKYPQGVDLVVETISGANTPKSINMLKQNGQIFVIGATAALTDNPELEKGAFISAETLIMKNLTAGGVNIQTLHETKPDYVHNVARFLNTLFEKKIIEPRISAIFEFRETIAALKFMMNRKNIGKILIRVK